MMPQIIERRMEIPEQQAAIYQSYQTTPNNTGKIEYRVIIEQDEDGRFVATCPDLQGVVTDGATYEEAMENVRYAIIDMLDSLGIMNKEFNLTPIIIP